MEDLAARRAAQSLLAAHKANIQFTSLGPPDKPATISDAYDIQDRYVALLRDEHGAVRMVHEASKAVKIPVVGMGGILRAEDAAEFMMAGATAVQVGTASYADPRAVENIANGLKRWCAAHDVAQVSSLTGSALL